MPWSDEASEKVTATGLSESVDAETLWGWLTATEGLYGGANEWVETMHEGHPPWKVREYYQGMYEQAVKDADARGFDLHALAEELSRRETAHDGDD